MFDGNVRTRISGLLRQVLLFVSKLFLLSVFFTLFDLNAPTQTNELLPEIDVYYKVQSELRIWFQAKQTRESEEPTQAEIGPSLDFYFKPWTKQHPVASCTFRKPPVSVEVRSNPRRFFDLARTSNRVQAAFSAPLGLTAPG